MPAAGSQSRLSCSHLLRTFDFKPQVYVEREEFIEIINGIHLVKVKKPFDLQIIDAVLPFISFEVLSVINSSFLPAIRNKIDF